MAKDQPNEPVSPSVRLPVQFPPRFNPPLLSYASGSWTYKDYEAPADRNRIVGPASESLRVRQRGVIIQDLQFANDWKIKQDPLQDPAKAPTQGGAVWSNSTVIDNPLTEQNNPIDDGTEIDPGNWAWVKSKVEQGKDAQWKKDQSILDEGRTYGFRFHYNPSQLSTSIGTSTDYNPGVLMTSKDSWIPTAMPENPAQMGITIYLNRIEDMSVIKYKQGEFKIPDDAGIIYEGRNPTPEELRGIKTRGTEYDLEFLFRVLLGRPMPTYLRGNTADLGVLFGQPVQLWLSRSMRYRGRINSMSWTHTSFNRFMVPMWTQVNIGFVRFPDGTGAWQGLSPNDGYQSEKIMGMDILRPSSPAPPPNGQETP